MVEEEERISNKLDFEETELRLGLPGGGRKKSHDDNDTYNANGKRGFVDLKLNLSSDINNIKNSTLKTPAAKAQVVGWPPVRSFRKNILTSQKIGQESDNILVKVSMDGAPYLRKVNINMYKSYQELSDALAKMFSSFTIVQGMKDFMNERKLMDLLNSSDYVPTYEDKDGDWMLVGDVPWGMFVDSCKRLRIMKGAEAIGLVCRKCIYKKLSDEELECCPICNIDLGCVPLEKLRPDHNLEDVRAKIFPYKRQNVKAPEIVPSVTTLPVRRKERSLSSLGVSTPRVSMHSGMTGRRSKSVARKALRSSTFSIEKTVKNEEDSGEEPDSSSSPDTLTRSSQSKRQNYSNAEPSSHPTPDKGADNGTEQREGKVDLWKPLDCLVEVANKSKCSRFISQGSVCKTESSHCHDNEGQGWRMKVKEHGQKLKFQDDKYNCGPVPSESEKPKKLQRIRQKKASTFGEFSLSPQAVLDLISVKCERRTNPIWFSLVASEDQQGDAPLPQISAGYLRIKDGNIPVLFIQKYLMKKLNLSSENEVEIRYMGQLIVPTLQLNSLVDMWLQTTTSERVPAIVGSSANDFVMVLAYARKVPSLTSS